jgi:YheO-like PAS domain
MRYFGIAAATRGGPVFAEIFVNLVASAILVVFGFLGGKYRERRLHEGKPLEEYGFYPFVLDDRQVLHFDTARFAAGVRHLLSHRDDLASRQLVVIGEQNDVANALAPDDRARYRKLYRKIDGARIIDDNMKFLDNYKRIVRLIGDTFPDSGIEILLHNLSNPARALYYIKNNVTGRNIESPATNLVHDLKVRRMQQQDKLNYELNIGSRKFKCTTIPIYREDFGLVGAICINIDVNFLQEVGRDAALLDVFFASLCKTDMVLDENILSEDEFRKAQKGKRHFRDFSVSA